MLRFFTFIALLSACACGIPNGDYAPKVNAQDIEEPIELPEDVITNPALIAPPDTVVTPQSTTYEQLVSDIAAFNDQSAILNLATLDPTDTLEFPVIGSATHAGFITIQAAPNDNFTAPINLLYDFDDAEITAAHGQFYRVQSEDENETVTAYDGELRFLRGTIGETQANDLDLDVRGALLATDSRLHVSANLTGVLLGEDAVGSIIRTPDAYGERFTITLDETIMTDSNVIISATQTSVTP